MWKRPIVVMWAAMFTVIAGAEEPPTDARPSVEEASGDRLDRTGVQSDLAEHGREEPVELGEFWLGVECYPAPAPLVEQLGLSDHGGLVVEHVVAESPAERAGMKRHDVIVGAGGKPVSRIPELVAAVDEAAEGELTLEVVRGGKSREVTVTPARRPQDDQPRLWREPPRDEDLDRLWQWFGRIGPREEWRRPFRLHFFHPGAILPPGTQLHPPLPDNMSVTIRKRGDESAEITVERDDDVWEVSEHDLDKLPDDVRPHVERMLGRLPPAGPGGLRVLPRRPGEPDDAGERHERAKPGAERLEQHLERQIDEINQRLEEMRRSLERRRKGARGDQPKPDKP